jgi:hypothetical protein
MRFYNLKIANAIIVLLIILLISSPAVFHRDRSKDSIELKERNYVIDSLENEVFMRDVELEHQERVIRIIGETNSIDLIRINDSIFSSEEYPSEE